MIWASVLRFRMKVLILFLSVLLVESVASAEPFVVIVRHAEKAANDPKDPDLSPAGHKRAEALARMLKDSQISAVFVTEFKRTAETATPTAKEAGVVPTIIPANDTAALVGKLRGLSSNALVVGHGNTIPNLVKAIGIQAPVNIPDEDYSEIFVVILGDKPELLRLHHP